MLDVVTAANENIYENSYRGLVFVDLRKAFDTVCCVTTKVRIEIAISFLSLSCYCHITSTRSR